MKKNGIKNIADLRKSKSAKSNKRGFTKKIFEKTKNKTKTGIVNVNKEKKTQNIRSTSERHEMQPNCRKEKRVSWVKKDMKTDLLRVIPSDECRNTLD